MVVSPVPTYKVYSDLAVVPIPTFLVVWIPTVLGPYAQVPPAPAPPPKSSLAIPIQPVPIPLYINNLPYPSDSSKDTSSRSLINPAPPPPIVYNCCSTLLTKSL